jgi:hypothetical protein
MANSARAHGRLERGTCLRKGWYLLWPGASKGTLQASHICVLWGGVRAGTHAQGEGAANSVTSDGYGSWTIRLSALALHSSIHRRKSWHMAAA